MFFINLLETNLQTQLLGKKIIYYTVTDSTNDDIWELVEEGESPGLIVIADNQKKGKGQRSNVWFSKPGHGIICSFLLSQKLGNLNSNLYSLAIPIGIINGIHKLLNIELNIKWPNDIYCKDKKIGGILIETKRKKEEIFFNIGIGINVNENLEDFPDELKGSAESIKIILDKPVQRELLLAYILNDIDQLLRNFNLDYLINTYNDRCISINNKVSFQYNNKLKTGIFKEITQKGQALIEYNNQLIISNGVIINT